MVWKTLLFLSLLTVPLAHAHPMHAYAGAGVLDVYGCAPWGVPMPLQLELVRQPNGIWNVIVAAADATACGIPAGAAPCLGVEATDGGIRYTCGPLGGTGRIWEVPSPTLSYIRVTHHLWATTFDGYVAFAGA